MGLCTDAVNVDEEITKCYEQIEYWSDRLEKFQKRKKEEERLNGLCKTLNKCKRCIYETNCNISEVVDSAGNCKRYKRDPKDGGYNG